MFCVSVHHEPHSTRISALSPDCGVTTVEFDTRLSLRKRRAKKQESGNKKKPNSLT